MPSLHCQIPNAPHGSVVLVDNRRVASRVFNGDAASRPIDLQVVGRTLATANASAEADEPWFARQALALGARGEGALRRLRVGVVGFALGRSG